jgi:hypothetical protein
VRGAEVEDGSLGSVTPVTPTDIGFTNRDFTCDIGIYYRRSVDDIPGLNSLAVRKTIRQSLNGVIGSRPDLPRIAYFGS